MTLTVNHPPLEARRRGAGNNPLAKKPTTFRGTIARGIAPDNADAINPTGGDFGAGLIRQAAIITRGEALGHYLWVDAVMLAQTRDAINAGRPADTEGIKSRFTHPELSGDGFGKALGRFKVGTLDGDVTRGDLHFFQSAHKSPDGDLAEYVLSLAAESPADFGTSIAFDHDYDAEDAFMLMHGGKREEIDDGYFAIVGFKSPDPLNVNNYPHARLLALQAIDVVDTPAANPTGLFRRGQEAAAEAAALCDYAFGLSTTRPTLSQFDLDPDRAGAFLARYFARNGLSIVKKETAMPVPGSQAAAASTPPAAPAADPKKNADGTPVETTATPPAAPGTETTDAGETEPKKPPEELGAKAPGQVFLDAFGNDGAVWFAKGFSFEHAQGLFNQKVLAENVALREQVTALSKGAPAPRGEAAPVSFGAAPDAKEKPGLGNKIGTNLARFAAGVKLPTK